MTREASGRRLGVLVVIVGTAAVAAVSFGLASADRSPGPPPTTVPGASLLPTPGFALSPEPASVSWLDAALPTTQTDPLGPTFQTPIWRAADRWWAALLDPATSQTRIYGLSADGATWQDTGRIVDERPNAVVDTLWADGHLYVASVVRDRATTSGVRITRFSPDPKTGFRPDPDFPVRLTERGVRSVSLARDGNGRLWLAIVLDGAVQVAHSVGNDAVWTPPVTVAGSEAVGVDDVAVVEAFGPGRLGVVWTELAANTLRFIARTDADAPDRWGEPESAFAGLPIGRDPISLAATTDGSVVVSLLTDAKASTSGSTTAARLVVARRDPGGTWSSAVAGRIEDRHGASTILVDPTHDEVDLISVRPDGGGTWQLKRSALRRLEFPSGGGTPLALPSTAAAFDLSGPKVGKGPLDPAAGVLVVGFDQATHRYIHALIRTGEGSGPGPSPSGPPPSGPPPSGPPPVVVQPIVEIDDTFDPLPVGAGGPNGWLVREGDPAGALAVVAATARGHALQLRSTATSDTRACKSVGPVSAGIVAATVVVRVGAVGTADATITSLRDHGNEAALVRFGSRGVFVYYAGPTKVRTTIAWRAGTWYRSVVRVDLGRRTYDWILAIDGQARPILAVRRVPFRDAAATAISGICAQSSSGRAGLELLLDRVIVTR